MMEHLKRYFWRYVAGVVGAAVAAAGAYSYEYLKDAWQAIGERLF